MLLSLTREASTVQLGYPLLRLLPSLCALVWAVPLIWDTLFAWPFMA